MKTPSPNKGKRAKLQNAGGKIGRRQRHVVRSTSHQLRVLSHIICSQLVPSTTKKDRKTVKRAKKIRMNKMIGFKVAAVNLAMAGFLLAPLADAFAPSKAFGVEPRKSAVIISSTNVEEGIDVRTGKQLGTFFLPKETIERAEKGSPIEKIKLEKDPTSAFVDVYEYARKIREGEMTWEEVEKADLDTVR